jgi:hypothetical protein
LNLRRLSQLIYSQSPLATWVPARDSSARSGADGGTRTRNRRFTKPLLCLLSYVGLGSLRTELRACAHSRIHSITNSYVNVNYRQRGYTHANSGVPPCASVSALYHWQLSWTYVSKPFRYASGFVSSESRFLMRRNPGLWICPDRMRSFSSDKLIVVLE